MASCCSQKGPASVAPVTRPGEWLRLGLAAVVAAQSMVLGMAINLTPPGPGVRLWIHIVLAVSALAVFLLAGLPIARAALGELRRGRIVVEQLFLLGIAGAFLASLQSTFVGSGSVYYEVVAVLVAIYTLGTVLGDRRRSELLRAVEALGAEFSRCTRISCCGERQEIPVAEVRTGDRVLVRPGDGIPVDGRLVEGEALVRESALNGEPYPVVRRSGDAVLAGSHLLDGAVVIEATVPGGERRLDSLLGAVREARLHPAPVQREADRIVAWFLPVVLAVAAGTWIYWTRQAGWGVGTFHALAVLLVACPCAMGLATPIGVWSALAALARRGLVCRSGEMIERIARCDFVVFDKTGTLSEEEPGIVDFVTAPGVDRGMVRRIAGAVELFSNHPIGRALAAWAPLAEAMPSVDSVRMLPGIGLEARVVDRGEVVAVRLGNSGVLGPGAGAGVLEVMLHRDAAQGQRVYICFGDRVVGLVLLRERLRESVPAVLDRLRALGMRAEVLTGDRTAPVLADLALPVATGLSPEAKAARVVALAGEGRRVLFVGDGINDAPAMERAEAAIAVGSGAELARESAGAILLAPDLETVAEAVTVCRSTVRAIRGNLLFAAAYNTAGIGLAASGLLHPVAAALVMFLSSGTVTWRALRHTRKLGVGEPEAQVGLSEGEMVVSGAGEVRVAA